MLIVIGVASGLIAGVWGTSVWGLRKAEALGPDLLLVVLTLFPAAYFLGDDAFGWPTSASIAESAGAVSGPADRWLLVGITALTAAVVVAVLVRAGVTRRLERWSGTPG